MLYPRMIPLRSWTLGNDHEMYKLVDDELLPVRWRGIPLGAVNKTNVIYWQLNHYIDLPASSVSTLSDAIGPLPPAVTALKLNV